MQPTKSYPVRSPYHPKRPHPVQQMRQRAMDTRDTSNPIRMILEKLCRSRYNLSATFSPDLGFMSQIKTEGFVAVKCELTMAGHGVIGIGHGSTAISRLNKGLDRALFGCLNGALMSAINNACKSLDVIRLEGPEAVGEAYRLKDAAEASESATPKQIEYLRQLISVNIEDERERESKLSEVEHLSKREASDAIAAFAR